MTVLAVLSLLIWIYLLGARGHFWQAGPVLVPDRPAVSPPVVAVVPARDEADLISRSVGSLLAQTYAGPFRVILVDDNSRDGTGDAARGLSDPRLTVLTGTPRPPGWSGKLWAVAQGIEAGTVGAPVFFLLTDADIVHRPEHVATLVAQAERGNLDMVSEMVALSCETVAERALIPAFVFFFQLLYPFGWVNEPRRPTAAAAGGTILIRHRALARIGGIAAIRGVLIDDVALANAVKRDGRIWLGHSMLARSIRIYPGLADIWRMIARSAYVQLHFSPLLLAGCTIAMLLTWIVPPVAAIVGHGAAQVIGAVTLAALAWSYLPTLRRFGLSEFWAPVLPLIALFYIAATIGSAINHHLGRGVAWKGRAYQDAGA
ncbi:MAG: glycosyltransferase [Acetobacteraceae bacterium]